MPISRRRFIATTAAASAAIATPALGSAPTENALSPDLVDVSDGNLFSDRARHVLELANNERLAMKHWYVGTEHLLLGLFAESEASGTHWLEDTGIHFDDISCVADYVIGAGDNRVGSGHPVKSDNLQACLDNAIDLACDLGHSQVHPEHLMLSIIESFGTSANMLLQEMWMERGQLRQVVAESLV